MEEFRGFHDEMHSMRNIVYSKCREEKNLTRVDEKKFFNPSSSGKEWSL